MAASIATSIIACLKSFNKFIAEIRVLPPHKTSTLGLVVAAWEDELGRLRMWAANIGAHQTGQSSLDFRLRDSSHIRQQIVKLLQDLQQRLEDTREILAEGEDAAENDEFPGDVSDDEEPITEIQEFRESIGTIINCLFQMSMLVRKPAQHDMIIGSRRAEVAMFEPFDYNHVREKYPQADSSIVERLGLAVTRRRKYLKYRERHALKLRQGIDRVIPELRNITVNLMSDTIATDTKEPFIRFDEGASDSGASQTSYAQTLLGGGDITIPRPPKGAQGGSPFECPYCHFVVTIKGTRSWSRHVFQDLQPYICIATTCATPDKLYSTRHEWLHHLKTIHPKDFALYLEKEDATTSLTCPLCRDRVQTERQYDRHVARHLQELALFILPRTDDETDADSDADQGDSGSDAESIAESDASEDDLNSRDPRLEALESYETVLLERYVPDCKSALHEVAFDASINRSRCKMLHGVLQENISKLQGLNLKDDRGIEDRRKQLVDTAKIWLDALYKELYGLDHGSKKPDLSDKSFPSTSAPVEVEDAHEKIGRPSDSSPSAKNERSYAGHEQHSKLFFCHSCGNRWHGDRGPEHEPQCPNCRSNSAEILDTNFDSQNSHVGLANDSDNGQRGNKMLSSLISIRIQPLGKTISVDNSMTIASLNKIILGDATDQVWLCFNGRPLFDESRTCREEGLQEGSEVGYTPPGLYDPSDLMYEDRLGEKITTSQLHETEGRTVVDETPELLLTVDKLWDRVQASEKFKSGAFDMDTLTSQLKAKAKVSGRGAVVDQKDVDEILGPIPADEHDLRPDEYSMSKIDSRDASGTADSANGGQISRDLAQRIDTTGETETSEQRSVASTTHEPSHEERVATPAMTVPSSSPPTTSSLEPVVNRDTDYQIFCDRCLKRDLRNYHHCRQCPNFDLCDSCLPLGCIQDQDHEFATFFKRRMKARPAADDRIEDIMSAFNTDILPRVHMILDNPPANPRTRCYASEGLRKQILAEIIYRLESLREHHDRDPIATAELKNGICEAQFWSKKLHSMAALAKIEIKHDQDLVEVSSGRNKRPDSSGPVGLEPISTELATSRLQGTTNEDRQTSHLECTATEAARATSAAPTDRPITQSDKWDSDHVREGKIIFIGNIPFDVTEAEIKHFCGRAGQVVAVRIVVDKETGASKGFGYAEFVEAASATSAVRDFDGSEVMGSRLRVDFAVQKYDDVDEGDAESKTRLSPAQVAELEREFRMNQKPRTELKNIIAQRLGLQLPRVNNWYQNRRAKAKQQRLSTQE